MNNELIIENNRFIIYDDKIVYFTKGIFNIDTTELNKSSIYSVCKSLINFYKMAFSDGVSSKTREYTSKEERDNRTVRQLLKSILNQLIKRRLL